MNCSDVPSQSIPPAVWRGVTVMVATCVTLLVLVAVKAGSLVVPFDANPMEVLSLVQWNEVASEPVKIIAEMDCPWHFSIFPGLFTVGVGFTETIKFAVAVEVPHALSLVTVMVKVTVFPASAATAVYVGVKEVVLVSDPFPL